MFTLDILIFHSRKLEEVILHDVWLLLKGGQMFESVESIDEHPQYYYRYRNEHYLDKLNCERNLNLEGWGAKVFQEHGLSSKVS